MLPYLNQSNHVFSCASFVLPRASRDAWRRQAYIHDCGIASTPSGRDPSMHAHHRRCEWCDEPSTPAARGSHEIDMPPSQDEAPASAPLRRARSEAADEGTVDPNKDRRPPAYALLANLFDAVAMNHGDGHEMKDMSKGDPNRKCMLYMMYQQHAV